MNKPVIIDREGLNQLISVLAGMGFQVVGPTVREEAIVYEKLESIKDLPEGFTDEQDGGIYRLKQRSDKALFGYTVGPHSWKKFLHPPERRLWSADAEGIDFEIKPEKPEAPKFAFLGVRACEMHAIAIQDKVFLDDKYVDPLYQVRRENAFFIAVNCGQAGGTCFCVSMNTGPKVEAGFDLALTEILDKDQHHFVVEVGSDQGAACLQQVTHRQAQNDDVAQAENIVQTTAGQMGRTLDTTHIKELLYENSEHPRWDDVAERCLSCANCTMVCPTCFCSTVEDVTDITGTHAERWQKWDSCFTMDFTYMHGGEVRTSTKSRYRQWLTHKLASWQDQFGSSGCVGCGRCITWCPPAIDLTEEVLQIRNSETQTSKPT
jgi:sulfhydrogenase subunit beta (sulfur reductase)